MEMSANLHDSVKGLCSHAVSIGGRSLSCDSDVMVVAELSANHNQRIDVALRTIDAAAEAGADAIKLQTYRPDAITFRSDDPIFRIDSGTVWDGRTLYDLYLEAQRSLPERVALL